MNEFDPMKVRFAQDERGAIAIIFTFAVTIVLFLIGISLDAGRAVSTGGKILSALDATALATAKAMAENELDDAELASLAHRIFEAELVNIGGGTAVQPLSVTFDRTTGKVETGIDFAVQTSFTRLFGYESIPMHRSASAAYNMKTIELSLVLDITGSMDGQKLIDLKAAAKDVIDILMPDNKVITNRIALAPYSASVNAGGYAAVASDGASVDGCVFERNGGHAYTDEAPSGGRYLGAEPDPASPSNPFYSCPASDVQPLTKNKALLKATIDGYAAFGGTAGHIGTAWGWYMISPSWNAVWPAASRPQPYNDPKTIKAIILMTDGEFNTSYENGPINSNSADQAIALCQNMIAEGVSVYAVAFQSPPAAEATLQACASAPGNFFTADNGTQLRQSFQAIAKSLQGLRITN